MKTQHVAIKDVRVRRNAAFELAVPSLAIAPGTVLCVAGPNGSGKSTLVTLLAGLLTPDAGTIHITGHRVSANLRAHKAKVGYIPDDEEWFIRELSAREYLALLAEIYKAAGVISDTLERAGMLAKSLYFTAHDQPLASLSHGNKRKVQLIAGLMHSPKVIIVDELRNGLDPLAIIAAEKLLQAEAGRGACIIAATHDLWWAQRISTRLLLLMGGSIAVLGNTKRLISQHGSIEALFMKQMNKSDYAAV